MSLPMRGATLRSGVEAHDMVAPTFTEGLTGEYRGRVSSARMSGPSLKARCRKNVQAELGAHRDEGRSDCKTRSKVT